MAPLSLSDLLALLKERGTNESLPSHDELHALLEPYRDLGDPESTRLALAAAVRKSDRLVARLAAQALAYLGGQDAAPLLFDLALDDHLPLAQRAAAVWAIGNLLPETMQRLSPDEQIICANLPVLEMIDDPEADNGFGFEALLETYSRFSGDERAAFVRTLGEFAARQGRKLAPVFMHLLKAEADPDRRRKLLDAVAEDATQEAFDLLSFFAIKAADSGDSKHARGHLRALREKGFRASAKADKDDTRVFVTGVDGDACCAVNFIVPRPPTFDVINLLLHLGRGLRDAFVRKNLPGRTVDDLVQATRDGSETIATFVPLPVAVRIVSESLASAGVAAKAAVDADPEVGEALRLVAPILEAGKTSLAEEPVPTAHGHAHAGADEVKELLDSEGFEYWFFEAGETTVRKSLDALSKPIRAKGKSAANTVRRRLEAESLKLCERLRADDEPERLRRMLIHQARLFEAMGDARAERCRRFAVEVTQPGSVFLSHMAVRSLIRGLRQPPEGGMRERFLEARAHLRNRAPAVERASKQDVARLDVAAVAHVEINLRNREAPSAQRAALGPIEAASLEIGSALVHEMASGSVVPAALIDGVVAALAKHELFAPADRTRVAFEAIEAILGFVEEICNTSCPHRCFSDLEADGRMLFYATDAPWDVEVTALRRKRRGGDAPSA